MKDKCEDCKEDFCEFIEVLKTLGFKEIGYESIGNRKFYYKLKSGHNVDMFIHLR